MWSAVVIKPQRREWDRTQSAIIAASRSVLGVSLGGFFIDMETWWWNNKECQELIQENAMAAIQEWQQSNSTEEDWIT